MKNIFYKMVISISLFSFSLDAQWVKINDLNKENISSLLVFKNKEGRNNLLAGINQYYLGGEIFLSTDDGFNWTAVDSGFEYHFGINCFAVSPTSNETGGHDIFAGTWEAGVYQSTDDGISWARKDSGLTYGFVYSIAISPYGSNGSYIFAGANTYGVTEQNIFLSYNNGATWNPTNFNLTQTGLYTITTINNNAGKVILFAGTDHGVLISSDNGVNWDEANSGLTNYDITSFALSGSDLFAGTGGGVFHTTNNGLSWMSVNSGLPKDPDDTTHYLRIYTLAAFPNVINRTCLFATSWYRYAFNGPDLYLSTNNGASWISFNTGLPSGINVNALAVSGGYLYAGTNSEGIWRRLLSDIIAGVENDPNTAAKSFELKQNYPNPFNPSTTISFSIPSSEYVMLKVYDVLGNEVATLVNADKPAGSYRVEFNAANISSGIYFYNLSAGSLTQSKKMILLK